jgi:hypothetical protein
MREQLTGFNNLAMTSTWKLKPNYEKGLEMKHNRPHDLGFPQTDDRLYN